MTQSLAYRKNAKAIWQGNIPEKYLRVARLVTGKRVLEIGSAEGVLALTMAQTAKHVVGVELKVDRHVDALELKDEWRRLGRQVDNCTLICGDIRKQLDLLHGIDTVVAVRSIYYLRESIMTVLSSAKSASEIVLCGNPHRWPRLADDPDRLGHHNYFASLKGMRALLTMLQYDIVHEVKEGDPIVVGRRTGHTASANYR